MEAFTRASFPGRIDSKGRITVPARIRDKLDLESDDRISIQIVSSKVIRKKVESDSEALRYVKGLNGVKSFSFDGEVLEVVLRE